MARNDKVAISCQNVWKIFGDKPKAAWDLLKTGAARQEIIERTGQVIAVKDVSFDVRENEIFVIMGLSGSGKSTLLRCINRLIEPDKGKIFINGEDVTRMNRAALKKLRRHQLSMVFQHFGLLPNRSVLENVAFGLEIRGDSKKEGNAKSMEALELVGLQGWENSRLHELSGGMQQRVGLARSLVVDSEILLMDEPFSALDPLIRRQLQDEFIKLRATVKKTVVFVTHDLFEALKLGDQIAIMKDGEIVQSGSPQDIVSRPLDAYVSEFIRDVPKAKILLADTIMEEPEVIVWCKYDVEVAIREMTAKKATVAFITDNRAELKGIVTMEQAIEAIKQGSNNLETIAQKEVPSTSPESPLEESLHFIAEGDIPVAVLDKRRHLLGVITRKALINAVKPEKPVP
ncbi:MAG: glycine betaine/L-proline ABC transporter ATP-binding protein [Dehalococcoidales bacterium]|nr:glycine betaine/L-proline ABC transporter ATP-binding protein [Dehalococcoidales bacterium]